MIGFSKHLFALFTAFFMALPAAGFEFTLLDLTPRPERIDLKDVPDLEQRITDRLTGKPDILNCLARLRAPSDGGDVGRL